jgi:hypothetical protein
MYGVARAPSYALRSRVVGLARVCSQAHTAEAVVERVRRWEATVRSLPGPTPFSSTFLCSKACSRIPVRRTDDEWLGIAGSTACAPGELCDLLRTLPALCEDETTVTVAPPSQNGMSPVFAENGGCPTRWLHSHEFRGR